MTKNEIKKKIAQLIGIANYSFGSYKTKEGVELKLEKEMMEIGAPIYVITPEGELPAPENDYELENGMVVSVKDGLIEALKPAEVEVEEMTEATLADGTKITNGVDADFEIGQNLFVIDSEGNQVPAPEGEHTTESGITLVVDSEGKITGVKKPDSEGEGTLVEQAEDNKKEDEELMKAVLSAVEALSEQMKKLSEKQVEMNHEFNKIKSAPAGTKVYDKKGFGAIEGDYKDKVSAMMTLRNNKSKLTK